MIPTVRILHDGKIGDEIQCLGVAEALGSVPDVRRIVPRRPYTWFMPWGPIDPKDASNRPGSPISPPYPDVAIATGRRAVPYIRNIRTASRGKTMTVFLKDPRAGTRTADLIWVPEHDKLRGDNVLVTITAPHRITDKKLKSARNFPDSNITRLSTPRVAVLVGGNSRHHRFQPDDTNRLVQGLEKLAQQNVGLMITTSRRTPLELENALIRLAGMGNHLIWNGTGQNPYIQFLASADFIVATADSTNMVGEAVSTGKPVLVFEPTGGHQKIDRFLASLSQAGAIGRFNGQLEFLTYEPINSTPLIADAIRRRLEQRMGMN